MNQIKEQIIYIAGPITGVDGYKKKFDEVEFELRLAGKTVLNPATLPLGLKSHASYLRICLPMLDECDAVLFLQGWRKSKGALTEYARARIKGMACYEFTADGLHIREVIDG